MLAVIRNAQLPSALRLASDSSVKVFQGYLDNVFALFQAAQKVVYSSVDRSGSDQSCGFFNDIAPGFEAKAFTTSFRDAIKDKLLEYIAIPGIGVFAAEGFIDVIDST
ncbi:hypothetical protein LZL87_013555 [Fusarium oxysporum]|nr:hypothetical protein LZL87_013555 [Fusarium oxysporum]